MELADVLDDFAFLDDWEDRYRYVLDLAKKLPPLAEAERTEANKVRGCASQVWVISEPTAEADPVLHIRGESDAQIVRGLIALLLVIYSGKRASEIVEIKAEDIFARIGLRDHLTAQRSNGLSSMIARIQRDAAQSLSIDGR
ncbi:MAG: SufE family protein [Alphaproteobacteria bacterium]